MLAVVIALDHEEVQKQNIQSTTEVEQMIYGDESLGIDAEVDESLKDYRNIVIYGLDAEDKDSASGHRSDAMMILSINKKTDAVKLFSVYRDTYLQINDDGTLDKTNHAYAYGGMRQSMKALNQNLDLNIREAITFNWKATADLVDALGGIEMDVQDNEIQFINQHLNGMGAEEQYITQSGTQTLSGRQAVAYSRIRYDSSDFKRNERMQAVLIATFKKAQTLGAGQLMSIMDDVVGEIDSNMSRNTMTEILSQIKELDIDENMGWPFKKQGWMHNEIYYCVPVTLASNVSELHARVFGQSGYVPTEFVQNVSSQIESISGYSQ
ncbi:LCP family protein [Zhenpiania hominis]|uniref:LCP family protein n=1 Tax=Zhenpiania hominis TaxID=2763644 RepID=A0A923NKH2_9FIRM|nr:LCP family protein [Zhenpiania hominis]